jgi:D-aminopeptidase
MADVCSACTAALAAGVDELIMCDTHHGGGNLDLERMPADPRITFLGRSVGYESACAEAREQFPGAVTAAVKRAVSRDRREGFDAESARQLTASRIADALERLRTAKPRPFKPALPMMITIRMASVQAAEKATLRPGVERLDEYTVAGRVERHCDVVKWINGTGLDVA